MRTQITKFLHNPYPKIQPIEFRTREKRENLKKKKQKQKFGKMLCGMIRRKKKTGTPVYVNVYDLMPINRYAYWFGFGFYHSGIQGLTFFFQFLYFNF